MCTAHRPFAQFKHTPDLIASTKLMIAMSSANIDAAMPRVIAYFEKHVKPRADEEAYRTLIRLCAKAMRGDLVGKYWQVRVMQTHTRRQASAAQVSIHAEQTNLQLITSLCITAHPSRCRRLWS